MGHKEETLWKESRQSHTVIHTHTECPVSDIQLYRDPWRNQERGVLYWDLLLVLGEPTLTGLRMEI